MAVANAINSQQLLSNAGTPTFGATTLTTSTSTPLTTTSTASGAAAGPIITLYRSKASTNADLIGELLFNGWDSATSAQEYAHIVARIVSNTAGSENGALDFYTQSTGTATLQMSLLNTGGQYRGNNTNTAPPAGCIGEILESKVAIGSAVACTSTTTVDLTSLSLTPGIWDVTIIAVNTGVTTGTKSIVGLSTNTASFTGTTPGDTRVDSPITSTSVSDAVITLPTCRVTLSATTTYYAVYQATYSAGTGAVYGRISAVRVG